MPYKSTNNKIIFSDEEKEEVRRLYSSMTNEDIGDLFGVSGPVISRLAREMGLQRAKGWSPALFMNRYTSRYKHNEKKREGRVIK